MSLLLSIICLFYALAGFFRLHERITGISMRVHAQAALVLGLGLHLLALGLLAAGELGPQAAGLTVVGSPTVGLPGNDAFRFPLPSALLTAAAVLTASSVALEIASGETFLTILLLPVAIALTGGAAWSRGLLEGGHFQGPWFTLHVAFSIAGESFFLMAAVCAAVYLFSVRLLKRKSRMRAIRFFPPLARLDRLTERFAGIGFGCFTAGILMGLYWAVQQTGTFSLTDPKRALAIALAGFFGLLVVGRQVGKVPGPKLAALTLVGFVVSLILAFGVNAQMHWFPRG